MKYEPIRILKDIQVSVRSRAEAELHYPHGTIGTVPVTNATIRLPGFTVTYHHPQRINVPTAREMKLCDSGYAARIPQHKELSCDDPGSELSGSRSRTREHRRKAEREIRDRQRKIPELEEAVSKEKVSETKAARKRPDDKPSEPENNVKEKSDV